MAEYPIYAKIDPAGVSTGAAKVKQELGGIRQDAAATQTAIDKAFDAQAFDRSIGALIAKLDSVEKELGGVRTASAALVSSNSAVVKSMDELATSAGRAAPALTAEEKAALAAAAAQKKLDEEARAAARAQKALDDSARKLIATVDQEAAEQAKLNALLAEANTLLAAGKISQEQFNRVQALTADGAKRTGASLGQQRAGYQQLGFQVQDITQSLVLGINPATVFAQQAGQTAGAVGLLTGKTTGFIGFLGGPYGAILIAATGLLLSMASTYIKLGNATDDAVKKLKEDAKTTEINRVAKERFQRTAEGVEAAIRAGTQATKDAIKEEDSAAERANIAAKNNLTRELSIRRVTLAMLEQAKVQAAGAAEAGTGVGGGEDAGMASALFARRQEALQKQADAQAQGIKDAEARVQETRLDLATEAAKRAADPIARINKLYDDQATAARDAARATGQVTVALTRQLTAIENRRKAALAAAAAEKTAERSGPLTNFISPVQGGRISSGFGPRVAPTAGASTFHRGIDIAAPTGTAVRAAAGGVVVYAGKLPGLGNAIIVDHGGGTITEYGHLSSILTAKGAHVGQGENIGAVGSTGISTGSHLDYRVKTGGRYVDPRTGRFRTDDDATSVRAANTAQTAADAKARKEEQERDFVSGVVNEAASRGVSDRQEGLQARIDRVLADFNRRFNRAANDNEKGQISKSLTDADARETANRFQTAYVDPLNRLRALQGKTGLDREVLNKQLEETDRLGRALTPTEAAVIENSVRQGDALERQAQVAATANKAVEEYRATVAALAAALANGTINQTQFNSRMGDLTGGARDILRDMPGVDPNSGQSYQDLGAVADEEARYAKEQEAMENNREALLQMGVNYDALEEAARQRHADNLRKIDDARKDQQLASAEGIAGSLLAITEATIGKNNAVYKALFVTEKAIAIARSIVAIQTGIALAAANPFPYNLAAIASVAAATASIVGNIVSVTAEFEKGGYTGNMGRKTPAGVVHGQEFVVNAEGTARNRALLEAINSGSTVQATRAAVNDNRMAAAGQGRGGGVTVQQHPGVDIETKEDMTTGAVEVIARRMVRQETPRVFSSEMADPNSRTSKAMSRNTLAGRRRT